MKSRRISRPAIYITAFIAAVVAFVAIRLLTPPPVVIMAAATATTQAVASAAPPPPPATLPAPPIAELLDVVRIEQPDYPTTQPLDLPADLPDAARIELSSPVYLDGVGNLWITSAAGQPIATLLSRAIQSHTQVVQERVLCASWPPDGGPPTVIFQRGSDIRSLVAGATEENPVYITPPPDWDRATWFSGFTVVPGDARLACAAAAPSFPQAHLDVVLDIPNKNRTPVVTAQTSDTLYAWQPWDNGQEGAYATAVDAAGTHSRLTAGGGWADKIIQLVPLADGSVLIISRGDTGVELKLKPSANPQPLTAEQLTLTDTLAHQLGDRDPVIREQAQRQLESLGPLIYPELEKLRETLPPGAQVRIESLLGQRFAPTLAGLRPLDGECRTITRFRDGGCVLELMGGGTDVDTDQTVIPAYIAIRPGRFIQRLELGQVANFDPAKYRLAAAGDEWIIVDPVAGPQRWIGQKVFPLLDSSLKDYDDLLGIDAQHRWLFRSSKRPGKTLIIDPSLPDTTPRLPTWTIDAPDGCGWTNLGWPAVKRGQKIFVLGESGWRLPGDGERIETTFAVAATQLTKLSLGSPTTQADSASSADRTALRAGEFQVSNLVLSVGLDNTVTRHRVLPMGSISEKPEAVFTAGLPRDKPRRVWLDPAGRLNFAGDQLTVTFPLGRVPKAIGDLMLRTTR